MCTSTYVSVRTAPDPGAADRRSVVRVRCVSASDAAVKYVEKTKSWEIGTDPTVVLIDQGSAKSLLTYSLQDDAYAYIFSQQGLVAGVNIKGTKISRINR